jgi:hypothetical protein
VPKLVRENSGEMARFQKAPGDHQRVAADRGVGLGVVDHEPMTREWQRLLRVGLQQLDGVLVCELLAFGWFAAASTGLPRYLMLKLALSAAELRPAVLRATSTRV